MKRHQQRLNQKTHPLCAHRGVFAAVIITLTTITQALLLAANMSQDSDPSLSSFKYNHRLCTKDWGSVWVPKMKKWLTLLFWRAGGAVWKTTLRFMALVKTSWWNQSLSHRQGPCAYPLGSVWLHVFVLLLFLLSPSLSFPPPGWSSPVGSCLWLTHLVAITHLWLITRQCSSPFIRWQHCVSRCWTVADSRQCKPQLSLLVFFSAIFL